MKLPSFGMSAFKDLYKMEEKIKIKAEKDRAALVKRMGIDPYHRIGKPITKFYQAKKKW